MRLRRSGKKWAFRQFRGNMPAAIRWRVTWLTSNAQNVVNESLRPSSTGLMVAAMD
jgi:hypothetical protein